MFCRNTLNKYGYLRSEAALCSGWNIISRILDPLKPGVYQENAVLLLRNIVLGVSLWSLWRYPGELDFCDSFSRRESLATPNNKNTHVYIFIG